MGLVQRHGCGHASIACAMRNLARQQFGVWRHRFRDAAVDDRHFQPLNARKHRRGQLRGEQTVDQVRGGQAPWRDDAVDRQAVVGGEDGQLRGAESRLQGVLHQAQPHGERLQLTQRTSGFAAVLQLVAQRLFQRGVGRGSDQRAVD